MEGSTQSRMVIVSRCFALVNWKAHSIEEIYPETAIGMLHLAETISFESGVELDTIQYYLYGNRDLDSLNDILAEKKTGLELVTLWLDHDLFGR